MSDHHSHLTPSTRPAPADGWLAGLLLRRQSPALVRFVYYRDRLRRGPRRLRRALRRRLALSVAGAALLLAMGGAPLPTAAARATPTAMIVVVDGRVAVNDDDFCSLIEAIENANNTTNGAAHDDCLPGNPGGADTISLPAGGHFTLTTSWDGGAYYWAGLPPIRSDVTIAGNGATIGRDPTAPPLALLTVAVGGRLTVENTVLAGGAGRDVRPGGAIYSRGVLVVDGCTLRGNSGGAIYAVGPRTEIRNSLITGNTNTSFGSAGVTVRDGAISIRNSDLSDNRSRESSGALDVYGGEATVARSRFEGNVAVESGVGAIFVRESQFELVDSVVDGNEGPSSGGLYLRDATSVIRNTTISANRGIWGAGMFSRDGQTTLDNSTVSGNVAIVDGAYGRGGGLVVYGDDVRLINTTIAGNRAGEKGGGLWIAQGLYGPSRLTADRSLITGNSAPLGAQAAAEPGQRVTLDGFNLLGANGQAGLSGLAAGASDVVPAAGVTVAQIIEPALSLTFGGTPTHALPPGSPAIDLAPSGQCAGQTDQRGVWRNQDGDGAPSANECDAGAFEVGDEPSFDYHALLPFVRR